MSRQDHFKESIVSEGDIDVAYLVAGDVEAWNLVWQRYDEEHRMIFLLTSIRRKSAGSVTLLGYDLEGQPRQFTSSKILTYYARCIYH